VKELTKRLQAFPRLQRSYPCSLLINSLKEPVNDLKIPRKIQNLFSAHPRIGVWRMVQSSAKLIQVSLWSHWFLGLRRSILDFLRCPVVNLCLCL